MIKKFRLLLLLIFFSLYIPTTVHASDAFSCDEKYFSDMWVGDSLYIDKDIYIYNITEGAALVEFKKEVTSHLGERDYILFTGAGHIQMEVLCADTGETEGVFDFTVTPAKDSYADYLIPARIKVGHTISFDKAPYYGDIYTYRNCLFDHGQYKELGYEVSDLTYNDWDTHFMTATGWGGPNDVDLDTRTVYGFLPGRATKPGIFHVAAQRDESTPFLVTIEEPVIQTNLPSEVSLNKEMKVTTTLTNVEITNMKVNQVKASNLEFPIGYQPRLEVISGSQLIKRSNGDYTNTLSSSETIKFVGTGTVVFKIRYEMLPIYSNKLGTSYLSEEAMYSPEKTVTVKVVKKETLNAPVSARATLTGYNDVKISWDKVKGAAGYKVYFKKASAKNYTAAPVYTTKLTFSKNNLLGGTKYTFKIVPCNASKKESTNYKTISISTLKKMPLPIIVKSNATTIKLSWNKLNGATGYQISKSTSKTGTNIIGSYTSSSKALTVTRNKLYYYKIRAYKTINGTKIFAPWSEVKSYNLRYVAPAANVKSILTGFNDVKITWKKIPTANKYYIYAKTANSAYKKYGSTSKTYFTLKNLKNGVKHTIKVVPAFTSNGNILAKGNAKTTNIFTLKKLSKPTVSASGNKVKVSWKNISGETGYQISKSTSKTGTNIVATYKTTSGTYKLLSATKGKQYYYKIRAYKVVNGKKIFAPWSEVTAYKRINTSFIKQFCHEWGYTASNGQTIYLGPISGNKIKITVADELAIWDWYTGTIINNNTVQFMDNGIRQTLYFNDLYSIDIIGTPSSLDFNGTYWINAG